MALKRYPASWLDELYARADIVQKLISERMQ